MSDYDRIVVRTPNWVGDAVMSLPFLTSLRLNAPSAEIVALTRPALADFFGQVSEITRVLTLDESHGRHGARAVLANGMRLRRPQFDIGFCLPPSFGAALIFWLGGVKRRIGHDVDHRRWLLTAHRPYGPNGQRPHRAEGYLSLLEEVWEFPQIEKSLKYDPGPQAREAVDRLWQRLGLATSSVLLAVAPGAAQPNKHWPTDRFAAVARRWLSQPDALCLVVGGQGDRAVCDAVANTLPAHAVKNLCGTASLPEVGEVIRRSIVFVGNDSGLAHLAAAVGTPVVAISGPGDPSEVAPYAAHAVTVKKPLFCSPCYRNTCYRKDHPLECQDLVSPEDVWQAIAHVRDKLRDRTLRR